MKLIKTFILTLIIVANSLGLFAKDFEGVIVYNITYEGKNVNDQMLAMMPKTMKLTIKGDMSKTEMNMGMGSQVTIFNGDTKSGVMLMDMMNQKFAVKMTSEDVEKKMEDAPEIEVVKTGNTREIQGYQCQEAIVKVQGEKSEFTVYYTDELGSGILNADNPYYKDIDGVMLEFAMDQDGLKMEFKAINVDKKKVSDKEFETPEGFKEISQDEFKNMFGGGF